MKVKRSTNRQIPALLTVALIQLTSSGFCEASRPVINYQYRTVNSFPHSDNIFTQGLVFDQGVLYESSGKYGKSKIITRPLEQLEPLQVKNLAKHYFAEGLTLLDNKLFQLTWKSRRGFVYQADSLASIAEFKLDSEGWGITHNNQQLIISNGSDKLTFMDPVNFKTTHTIRVTFEGSPVHKINELEWINGLIYANIWQSDWIIMIDPDTGQVVGKVYLKGLLPKELTSRHSDVLNGIAYDHQQKRLLVTGKYWPRIYHIELFQTPDFH